MKDNLQKIRKLEKLLSSASCQKEEVVGAWKEVLEFLPQPLWNTLDATITIQGKPYDGYVTVPQLATNTYDWLVWFPYRIPENCSFGQRCNFCAGRDCEHWKTGFPYPFKMTASEFANILIDYLHDTVA